MEEAHAMASRRSLVQNVSKTGRNSLVQTMDEEVRLTIWVIVVFSSITAILGNLFWN